MPVDYSTIRSVYNVRVQPGDVHVLFSLEYFTKHGTNQRFDIGVSPDDAKHILEELLRNSLIKRSEANAARAKVQDLERAAVRK